MSEIQFEVGFPIFMNISLDLYHMCVLSDYLCSRFQNSMVKIYALFHISDGFLLVINL